jgi:hypothetical protein
VKTDTYLEAPKRTVKLGIPVKILMIASSSRGRGKYPGKREKVCMEGICDFSYASLISYYLNIRMKGEIPDESVRVTFWTHQVDGVFQMDSQ